MSSIYFADTLQIADEILSTGPGNWTEDAYLPGGHIQWFYERLLRGRRKTLLGQQLHHRLSGKDAMYYLAATSLAFAALATGCSGARDEAAAEFASRVRLGRPYQVVSTSVPPAGGRNYVLVVAGQPAGPSIEIDNFEPIEKVLDRDSDLPILRGPSWRPGFSGDCTVSFHEGDNGEGVSLASGEVAVWAYSDCRD